MTSLVACLTTGKGSWVNVSEIIRLQEWDRIFLVTNAFGAQKYLSPKRAEFVIIDSESRASQIRDAVHAQLKGKIADTEVALNISSGSGYEHAAVISALLRLGLGIRFVEIIDGKIEEV